MRSIRLAMILVAASAIFAAHLHGQDVDLCADVLRDGVFDTEEFMSAADSNSSFVFWQCSSKFRTHDEALDAGLNIGAVIYGIPIELGGTWDTRDVEAWKEENCSLRARQSSLESATYRFLRHEAPGILSAWSECMQDRSSSTALECKLTRHGDTGVFEANWKRAVGETLDAVPIVSTWTVVGGSCQPGLQPGQEVGEAARQARCRANEDEDLLVMLETQRGSCWKTLLVPLDVEVIAGRLELSDHRTIGAGLIELRGATIVTNGYELRLNAEKQIRFSGSPKILSFTLRSGRPAGNDGRHAGTIVIQAPKAVGDVLFIENHGEDGTAGGKGAVGSTGTPGRNGRGGIWKNFRGCVERQSATAGAKGGTGGKGSRGGHAGDGGNVTVALLEGLNDGAVTRIVVSDNRINPFTGERYSCSGTCRGSAGPGGPGGDGGPGGRGGGPARARSTGCNGVGGKPNGPQGDGGPQGDPGRVGRDGVVTFVGE